MAAAADRQLVATLPDGDSDCGESTTSKVSSSLLSEGQSSMVLAQQAAGKTPAYHFRCVKCKKDVPLTCMSVSRPGWCRADDLNYKSLTQRWAKDRSLKTWWQAKSEEQKTAWFVSQQSFSNSGQKRKFDQIGYADESVKTSGTMERDLDHFQTFEIWSAPKLLQGKTLPQLEREWQSLIQDSTTEAIMRRGQWLIPCWQGIVRERNSGEEQRSVSSRSSQIETPEQLQQLQSAGRLLLDAHAASVAPAGQVYAQQPSVISDISDQPMYRAPTDVMGQQIHREAYLVL